MSAVSEANMNCFFCQEKIEVVDYKESALLRKFVSSQFKIRPNFGTQLCPKHQRKVANAIKLARFMALMPYTKEQTRKK